MRSIDLYGMEMTQNRDSLKMPYIYSTLTWLAEWEDFMAHSNAQKFRGGEVYGPPKL